MMMHYWQQILLAAFVYISFASQSDAANILVAFPSPGKSHWFSFKPLFEELSKRGHNITLIIYETGMEFPESWEVITVSTDMPEVFNGPNTITSESSVKEWQLYEALLYGGVEMCNNLFQEEAIQKLINRKEKKFDLLMLEYFIYECLLGFAYKLDIPVIGLSAFGGFSWTSDTVGDPYPAAYVPDILLDYTDHMCFFQRLKNALMITYARYLYNYQYVPRADAVVKKYFKDPSMPSISELERNTSLLIVQSHPSVNYIRPHVPSVVETGGMHVQQPKPLPENLQKILDNAKDGAIYFSMGSHVRSSDFPTEHVQAFLKVFSKLKQTVVWKWEEDNLPGKPSNVVLGKWFPQTDVLAHKNVRLFISHGGLQGSLEATARGVPIIGISIGAEQKYNVQRIVTAGYGLKLALNNITEQSVEWAVSEVLNNPKYRETAKLKSKLFWDRPQSPVETAVCWTEYVLRHNGARHLRSAALDLTWYQHLLLDVIGALILAVAVVIFIAVAVIKAVFRLVSGTSSSPHVQKKKKITKKD